MDLAAIFQIIIIIARMANSDEPRIIPIPKGDWKYKNITRWYVYLVYGNLNKVHILRSN